MQKKEKTIFKYDSTTEAPHEKAILVALILPETPDAVVQEHLDELAFLAETAGAVVYKQFKQRLPHPNTTSYVGKGKQEEIKEYAQAQEIDIVIFDAELTPKQQNFLERDLKCKVLDRSMLILDIFAQRARTAQARTQVELAQMEYLLPRLRGMWTHLERQRGGIGMRGPGEKEIETDRRIVRDKIADLKKDLEKIERQSATRRKERTQIIRVALVGYTNVGKSTLMNTISKSEVFAENKLFATLDTTVRKVVMEHTAFLLSDTVGFIRKLPHMLIESFKSTLDEACEADILLHVVDIAHPQYEDHMNTVNQTLKELNANDKPTLIVFNKIDLFKQNYFDPYLPETTKIEIMNEIQTKWTAQTQNECVFISATQKEGMEQLRTLLLAKVREMYAIRYPYQIQQQPPGNYADLE